ncbi:Elongation factor 2 [Modicella reniformis]|uniref:Elongation factor 2 n=1 Tax=Modicella reniformis TaxID=1440133 RepID=A0A9P6M1J7_9FUNG|nr:Elongation factor 2 [Modicella reniformis]
MTALLVTLSAWDHHHLGVCSQFEGHEVLRVPVVQVVVECKGAFDLPKLIESLKRLQENTSLLDLESYISKELVNPHAQNPIRKSDPVVQHRETIATEFLIVALEKSLNKHNRLFPLENELSLAIDGVRINQCS